MSLDASQRQVLHDALLSAFPSKSDLAMMVRFELGQNLDYIAGGESLSTTVIELIRWAAARGRTAELIQAARAANPGNRTLQEFFDRLSHPAGETLPPSEPAEDIPGANSKGILDEWLQAAQIDFSELEADRTRDFYGREWVFESIGKWLASGERDPFLLVGGPGTGKTAVAFRLIQFSESRVSPPPNLGLPPPPFLAAKHICSMRISRTLDPRLVARSLAGQLAAGYPAFDRLLRAGAIDPRHLHTASDVWNNVLITPLAQLRGTPIVILIDSLDESEHYAGAETLVDLLLGTGPLANVRWLLTTRDEVGILPRFRTRWHRDLVADAPRNQHEVEDYAYNRLGGLRLNVLSPGKRRELARKVASPDQGNFLYARYVLDDIVLRLGGGESVESIRLPRDLAGFYQEFLDRLLGGAEDRWNEQYGPLLGAIATALGSGIPFLDMLQAVTGQSAEVIQQGLGKLRPYLAEYNEDGPYRLYHQSFADFLLDRQMNPRYWIDPRAAHRRTAERLLARWNDDWKNSPSYARRFLPAHLLAALPGDPAVGPLLVRLLTTRAYLEARMEMEGWTTISLEQDFDQARRALPPAIAVDLERVAFDRLSGRIEFRAIEAIAAEPGDLAAPQEDPVLFQQLRTLFTSQLSGPADRVRFLSAAGLTETWLANHAWDKPPITITRLFLQEGKQRGAPLDSAHAGYTILGAVLAQMIEDAKVGSPADQQIAEAIRRYELIDLAQADLPPSVAHLFTAGRLIETTPG